MLGAIGNLQVAEGTLLELVLVASDPNGEDVLTLVAENLPAGAVFDAVAGTLTWRPGFNDNGLYEGITFRVSDNGSPALSDEETISITVTDANGTPTLAAVGVLEVVERGTLTVTLNASDPDAGDTLVYFAANLPAGASLDSVTGELTWTPGEGDVGTYGNILFSVVDNGQLAAQQLGSIVVQDVNYAPILEAIGNLEVNEGETLSVPVIATDPDSSDVVTISVEGLPDGASFASNTLSWTPGFLEAGTYTGIVFEASDNGVPVEIVSETIVITVNDVNRPPVLNTIGPQSVNEGETLTFSVTATDADTLDTLTLTAENLPEGATFEGNVFTWTTDFTDGGVYSDVTFMVVDDGQNIESDSETITITVNNINRPPVLEIIGNKSVNEGQPLEFQVRASDPDTGDSVSLSVLNAPTGSFFDFGWFSWDPGFSDAGIYPGVQFVALDDGDPLLSDSETIVITVNDVNRPPILQSIGNRTVMELKLLSFEIGVSDPDPSDVLEVFAGNLPPGAEFDSATREFTWTPTLGDEGEYPGINFLVWDGKAGDSESITITVTRWMAPPIVDFEADVARGLAPLTVQFSDLSTDGSMVTDSWDWDFGDGGTSSDQNPSHEYATAGEYTVRLTAGSPDGEATATKNAYILVVQEPGMVDVAGGWFQQGTAVADPHNLDAPIYLMHQLAAQGWGESDQNGVGSAAWGGGVVGNGIPDMAEFAMIETILRDPGAPNHASIIAAWNQNVDLLETLTTTPGWQGAASWAALNNGGARTFEGLAFPLNTVYVLAAYVTLGDSTDFAASFLGGYDTGTPGELYDFAGAGYDLSAAALLGAFANPSDGDASSNLEEWNLLIRDTELFYLMPWSSREEVGFVFADGIGTERIGGVYDSPRNSFVRHFTELGGYRIGKFEVTNAEYAEVLNWALENGRLAFDQNEDVLLGAGGEKLLAISNSESQITFNGLNFLTISRDSISMGDHPVVAVTWYGAVAYCNWLSEMAGLTPCYDLNDFTLIKPVPEGFRLPTEAEWERAAGWDTSLTSVTLPDTSTGGAWVYGHGADLLLQSMANTTNAVGIIGNPLMLTLTPFTTPVGYYDGTDENREDGPSPAGIYDAAGNVAEWCYDLFAPYNIGNVTDPTGSANGEFRILRGGSWGSYPTDCRVAYRAYDVASRADGTVGLRVARNIAAKK